MPKTPEELRKQLEEQDEQPKREGHDRTAEGLSVPTPTRGDFFGNLSKASEPSEPDE